VTREATKDEARDVERRALAGKWLVLYDGLCGFCDRTVRFTLDRDRRDLFRFAPLQGWLAHEILGRHGLDPSELSTVYLVQDPFGRDEKLHKKSKAVFKILQGIGGIWRLLAWVRFLPLDWGYDLCARNRYKIYSRMKACRIPSPEERQKFVGLEIDPHDGSRNELKEP
jgi:predicted DCC family thiol-disulfide oxidoreductase YuxK